MKKILIISYFFPPCNLTASQRIMGWAIYLSEFGYYPVVVTRNWEIPINTPEDALISTGEKIIHEKNNKFEVYYLPYKATKRDTFYSKNKNNQFAQKFTKIFTFAELVLESYFDRVIPSIGLYNFSRKLLKEDSEIQTLLISAKPFIQFKFGYKLNKEFGVNWIADYRDDWNTSDLESKNGLGMSIISKIQSKSEKKWLKSASIITTISNVYADKISRFVQKEGIVLLNGFDGITVVGSKPFDKKTFNITYNGSLYSTQPIEPLLEAVKKIIKNKQILLEIHIHFPGLGFHKSQEKRVRDNMVGFEKNIHISGRVSKNEVLGIQENSDILIMISHSGHKGVSSSKMYEYIGLKKQILLYPNDHDIVEATLNDTGLGIICEDEDDIYTKLLDLIVEKQQGNVVEKTVDLTKINFYSRKNQTKELAKLLDRL